MKNVIVTGATGYIGYYLVKALAGRGTHVIAIVRNSDKAERLFFGLPQVSILACPMEDYEQLPNFTHIRGLDAFYHLAWDGTAGKARADYQKQCRNTRYTCDAAVAAKKMGCNRFITTGTITELVADDILRCHYTAENLMYGLAKSFTHRLLDIVARQLELDYIWAQLSNIYGGKNTTGNLISYTMNEIRTGRTPIYGPCEQPYNFTYIDDVIEALICLGDAGHHNDSTYFISNGECYQLKYYLQSIGNILGKQLGINQRPDDGVRYDVSWFDSTPLQKEFGFVPKYQFEDGLKEILKNDYKV